ncbi:hypothetical protein FDI23_gp243 [Serratia phage CHI14]|uniref:Uncharacterized protein n=2 Tax=Winklervirus chi14 TaxID=2560752 RepID=A0A1Z1LYG5_9CAUD|nr:hypothetical protein FDI23_gp243 [Serratia phage CHI14]ARW57595.1 hypothetical protein [Serratia phage CHI14]ARW57870.1 hypothetical protein [Serratia phage CBH8]UYM28827.1 hypothetical protein [Serratia phage vB_SspM_LC53]
MITNTHFVVPITNRNVTAFKSLGYEVKSGVPHLIEFDDCPGKTVITCRCDTCSEEYTITKAKLNETNTKFCMKHRWEVYSEDRKDFWNSEQGLEIRKVKGPKISKSKKGVRIEACCGSNNGRWNPNKDAKRKYYSKVRGYSLKHFRREIEKLPNFELSGKCGIENAYQLDHKVSIKYGFENNVPPEIIGHICNLEMIPWEQNRQKDSRNSVDLETLNLLIEKHDRKQ